MDTLKFKAWLVEHNIKQKDLAKLLDITPENLSAKLNGKQDFTLAQVKIICSTYHISADVYFV